MAAENDKKYVADTGLTQIEMGACVGAWVAIFTFFSFVDITGEPLMQPARSPATGYWRAARELTHHLCRAPRR